MATPVTIRPAEGKWLTQVNLVNENERFFSELIILGKFDKAENYVEWTNEQKVEWEKNHRPEEPEFMTPEP